MLKGMKKNPFGAIALLVTLALAAVSPARAFEPAFGNDEQLTFAITYRAALVPNIDVAAVTMNIKKDKYMSQPVYHIHANGKVARFFKGFFDINDTYQVWMDTMTLKPLKATSDIREGNYRFSSTYIYDWAAMKTTNFWRNHKRDPENKQKAMKLTKGAMDGVSLFYNLRATDISTLAAGKSQTMKLVLHDTIRVISYKYLGRENKEIKGVGTFKTLKFSLNLVTSTGESFEDGTELFLWVTDDRNKIPLLIETPIRVGSVKVRLTKFSGLRFPLESKIN